MRYIYHKDNRGFIKRLSARFVNMTTALVLAVTGIGGGILPLVIDGTAHAVSPTSTVVNDNFDGYDGTDADAPQGWVFSGIGNYQSGHTAGNSLQFNATGSNDGIATRTFSLGAGQTAKDVSFWLKSNDAPGENATHGSFTVSEAANSNIYTEVKNGFISAKDVPTSWTKYTFNLSSDTNALRLEFSKTDGNLALDDLIVTANNSAPAQAVTVGTNGDYATLQEGIDNVASDGTITVVSNISTGSQVNITKPVTINGGGFTLTPSSSLTGSNGIIAESNINNVVISNLVVDGSNGGKVNGINAFKGTLTLNKVTLKNNGKYGLIVNSANVTVDDISTADNAWGGIDVDQNSKSSAAPAVLTVNGVSHHTETGADIYIDDYLKPVSVIDTNNQYSVTDNGNGRVYKLKTPAPAKTTVVVMPGNKSWTTSDTRANGHVSFVTDPSAPSGNGALSLKTDANPTQGQDKAQYYNYSYYLNPLPLSSITGELSYYTKQNSASFVAGDPSYQIPVNLQDATGKNVFATLTYEPYVDQGNSGVKTGVWQKWTINRSTSKFYVSHSVANANGGVIESAGPEHTYTLDQINAIFPHAEVLGFGANLGSGNPGYDTEVDDFTFNNTTYNFEPTPTDTTGPTIHIQTPTDNAQASKKVFVSNAKPITVSGTADDPSGIAYNVVTGGLTDTTTGKFVAINAHVNADHSWSTTVPAKTFADNDHITISVAARDTVNAPHGNVGSAHAYFIVDNTGPEFTAQLSDTLFNKNNDPTLTGKITDSLSNIDYAQYAIWNYSDTSLPSHRGSVAKNWTKIAGYPYSSNIVDINTKLNLNSLPEGKYILGLRSADAAGNEGSAKDIVFIVDTTPPAISITDPTSGSQVKTDGTDGLTIYGTAADNTGTVNSGINLIWIKLCTGAGATFNCTSPTGEQAPTVDSNGKWSFNLSKADLSQYQTGDTLVVQAMARDGAINGTTIYATYTVNNSVSSPVNHFLTTQPKPTKTNNKNTGSLNNPAQLTANAKVLGASTVAANNVGKVKSDTITKLEQPASATQKDTASKRFNYNWLWLLLLLLIPAAYYASRKAAGGNSKS